MKPPIGKGSRRHQPIKCKKCGYDYVSKSRMWKVTCPSCGIKNENPNALFKPKMKDPKELVIAELFRKIFIKAELRLKKSHNRLGTLKIILRNKKWEQLKKDDPSRFMLGKRGLLERIKMIENEEKKIPMRCSRCCYRWKTSSMRQFVWCPSCSKRIKRRKRR